MSDILVHIFINYKKERIYTTIQRWPLTSKWIYRDFDMSSCPANDFFQLWHWLTIFGKLVYYHERMCCVYSWSKYDVDLYLKMKFMWFLWLCVRATVFVIWHIPYLAHECIGHRAMCHVHSRHMTFGLNITIIFSSWICVWVRSSMLFDIGIPDLGLLPWDGMCTYVASGWPRLLTYMLVVRGILIEFY